MNQLIAMFIPSIICVNQLNKIYGEEKALKNVVERYLISILLVNLIEYVFLIYVCKRPDFIFTNQFTVKYIILAIIISYILPIVIDFIKKNIDIKIKVEKNEKKN